MVWYMAMQCSAAWCGKCLLCSVMLELLSQRNKIGTCFPTDFKLHQCVIYLYVLTSSPATIEYAVPDLPALATRPEDTKTFFQQNFNTSWNRRGHFRTAILLTHSVNKELWFGWKIVVDHVVQHGNIDSTGLV